MLISLVVHSLCLTVIGMIWLMATPLLLKRYEAKTLYYSWLLVMGSFLLPFNFDFAPKILHIETPAPVQSADFTETMSYEQATNIGVTDSFHHLSWMEIAIVIWISGIIIFWLVALLKHYRLRKWLQRWSVLDDETTRQRLTQLQQTMGMTRQIGLKRCSLLCTPMLIGLIKPTILLPSLDYTESELRLILKHELIHFQRRDALYKLFSLIVWSIHWFNPFFYRFLQEIERLGEYSCDEAVVADEDVEGRKTYSRTIVLSAANSSGSTLFTFHLRPNGAALKQRIVAIMKEKRTTKGTFLVGVVTLLIIGSFIASSSLAISQSLPNYIDQTFMKSSILSGDHAGNFTTDHYIIASQNYAGPPLVTKQPPLLPGGVIGYEARYRYPIEIVHDQEGKLVATAFHIEYDYQLFQPMPADELNAMIADRLANIESALRAIDDRQFTSANVQAALTQCETYIDENNDDSRVFLTFGLNGAVTYSNLNLFNLTFRSKMK